MNLTTHIWDQYQASFFPAQNVNGPCECCCFLWLQKEQSMQNLWKCFFWPLSNSQNFPYQILHRICVFSIAKPLDIGLYWFGVPWTRWTSMPITPAGRTRFWRISKVLRSSGCARMRSAVVMAPAGFGVQISKLPTFPMLPHLKHENDETYRYHIDTLKDHASPTFCGQTKLRIPKNLKDHCSRSYLYTIVVWSTIIVNANSLPTCILIAEEATTITLLGEFDNYPLRWW